MRHAGVGSPRDILRVFTRRLHLKVCAQHLLAFPGFRIGRATKSMLRNKVSHVSQTLHMSCLSENCSFASSENFVAQRKHVSKETKALYMRGEISNICANECERRYVDHCPNVNFVPPPTPPV